MTQAGRKIRADAAGMSATTTAATTPPPDLTQAIAVAGFLLVRFGNGSFDVEPALILKSLASLQLLVAAVALLTRGVHSDRVSFLVIQSIYKHLCLLQTAILGTFVLHPKLIALPAHQHECIFTQPSPRPLKNYLQQQLEPHSQ